MIPSYEQVVVDWGQESPERQQELRRELDRLLEGLQRMGAVRVILFGSRARGTANVYSDIDIIVVMPHPPEGNFPARLAAVYRLLKPRVSADILVYTPTEFERLRASGGMVAEAIADGVELLNAE